ncbi:MAG: DUF6153 family protein [Pseudonocardiaceae bacterium]
MWGGVGLARHQWLLIVAIVAGLVGMHHLVHDDAAHPMPMTMASVTPTEHVHPAPAPIRVTPVAVTSTLVPHVDCCDPMNMMGHLCLAVLTAIIALVATMIFAAVRRRPLEPEHVLAAVSAVAARAPPIGCARLTQLCVLRR